MSVLLHGRHVLPEIKDIHNCSLLPITGICFCIKPQLKNYTDVIS